MSMKVFSIGEKGWEALGVVRIVLKFSCFLRISKKGYVHRQNDSNFGGVASLLSWYYA